MDFVKMHGSGNDFVCLDRFFFSGEEAYAELARRLCPRNTGVGADGILVILPSSVADVRMRIFNLDGSEAEMCGNGLRCLARFVYDAGYVKGENFCVETLAGIKGVSLEQAEAGSGNPAAGAAAAGDPARSDDMLIRVDMGEPRWKAEDIRNSAEIPAAGSVSEAGHNEKEQYTFTAVSMGNPHCVVFCPDVRTFPVARVGAALEMSPLFPNRTNVEFVTMHGREEMSLRVWERGVGETMACGTGACAAVAAAVLEERAARHVLVHLPGGDLQVDWQEEGSLYLKGPARYVFRGYVNAACWDGGPV